MPSASPIVYRLLIVWVAVWLLTFFTQLTGGEGVLAFLELDFGRLLNGDIAALPGILGYSIAHAPYPGVFHLLINGYLLWVFGPEVETLFPGRRFLRFLLIVVLVGAGVHLVLHLVAGGPFAIPVIGGSGIVMAVLAVHAAIYPERPIHLIFFTVRMLPLFLVFVGLDIMGFLYGLSGRTDGVAVDVHLAGAATGWIWARGLGRFPNPLRRTADKLRQARQEQKREAAVKDEQELDRILAKINREGMPSLTESERRFLQKSARKRQ